MPEWYIVYSADEFGAFVQAHAPSDFPYFQSIKQFWCLYRQVLHETWQAPAFNWGYHVMIGVIGVSYTAEYFFKGLYESTVGATTAWLARNEVWSAPTAEDRFIQQVASDYAGFIHATPWYEYPFSSKLSDFWKMEEPPVGSWVRRWERRFEFTIELLLKAAWGWTIKQGTQAGYDPEAMEIQAWVKQGPVELADADPGIKVLQNLGGRSSLVSLPRYEPFSRAVKTLIEHDARLVEVAGNDHILMTLITPTGWHDSYHRGTLTCEWRILTDPVKKRVALLVPIGQLHEIIPSLEREGLTIDHLYDF